jgi:putative methionine-R-sulfoxide reductase with GAF domain
MKNCEKNISFKISDFQDFFVNCYFTDNFDRRDFFNRILAEIAKITNSNLATIHLKDSENNFIVEAMYGFNEEQKRQYLQIPFQESEGIIGYVAERGGTYHCPDTEQDDIYRECIGGILSECCVPIKSNGIVCGTINLESFEANAFSEEQIIKLEIASLITGLFLDLHREKIINEVRKLTLETINEISKTIITKKISEDRLKLAIGLLIDKALIITNSDGGQVFLPTPTGRSLSLIVQKGPFESGINAYDYISIDLGKHICGKVAESGIEKKIDDTSKCPDYLSIIKGAKSEIAVPIKFNESPPYGVLNLESTKKANYSNDDLFTANLLASGIASLKHLHAAQKSAEIKRTKAVTLNTALLIAHRTAKYISDINYIISKAIKDISLGKSINIEDIFSAQIEVIKKFNQLNARLKTPFENKDTTPKPIESLITQIKSVLDIKYIDRAINDKNIKVQIIYADKEYNDILINTNENAVREILNVLICNACEAVDQNGTIAIICGCSDHLFRITVADDGIGLPDLFDKTLNWPFMSLVEGKVSGEKGEGIGLFSAKALARMINGDLCIEEGVNAADLEMMKIGAAFTMTMPLNSY